MIKELGTLVWVALFGLTASGQESKVEIDFVQVTADKLDAEDPGILQSSDGRIWIAWFAKDSHGKCHLWCRNTKDGKQWSETIQITNNPQGDNWYPSILQDKEGIYCVAWWSGRTGNADIWFCDSTDGVTWSEPIQLTRDPAHDWCPSLAQAADGTYWIAWSSNQGGKQKDLWISRSKNRRDWSEPERAIHSELSEDFPTLVPHSKSEMRIAYVGYSDPGGGPMSIGNDSAEIYTATTEGGKEWSKPERLTENRTVDTLPTLIAEPNGDYSVFWTSNSMDSHGDVVGLRVSKGKRDKPCRITKEVGKDYSPRVLRAQDGLYWMAWVSNRSGGRAIWLRRFGSGQFK